MCGGGGGGARGRKKGGSFGHRGANSFVSGDREAPLESWPSQSRVEIRVLN